MKTSAFLPLVSFLFVLNGCSYALESLGIAKPDSSPTQKGPATSGKASDNAQLITFEVVKNLSLKTCLECHAGMSKPEKVLQQRNKILSEINSGDMPPKSKGYEPLSTCERNILESWIDDQLNNRPATKKIQDLAGCGVQDIPTSVTPMPPHTPEAPPTEVPPTEIPKKSLKDLEATFENLKKEVLEPKCLACHTTEKAVETVLEDPASIQSDYKDLLADKAEDSTLYKVCVTREDGTARMPPKKSKIPVLTPDELDLLKRWIESERK